METLKLNTNDLVGFLCFFCNFVFYYVLGIKKGV